jgi:uncharacterized protein (TIGR02172 family)
MTHSLGQRLAEGATAEVYAWEPGWILKLFRDWAPATWVDYEAGVARAVHASGVPVPAVGDVIETHGRRGILYERVDGPSLLRNLMVAPWKVSRIARMLADLHVNLHAQQGNSDLPSQRERFQYKIRKVPNLPEPLKEAVLRLLDTLPDGDRLCHNDFHPDNILMTSKGPVVIDWMDASRGNPHADVVRTSLMLQIGQPPHAGRITRRLINIARKQLHAGYLRHYCRRTQTNLQDLNRWMPVIAAVRLLENHDSEAEQLLQMINAGVAQYLKTAA